MWLRRLRVRAFGALTDESLELEQGLNIVHGPNATAKSTWHAALTVGLCGRRRGAGRRGADSAFEDRHRPWDDPDRWGLQLELMLDDGRQIEIDRDLLTQQNSVTDLGLGGREVDDDLIRDGSPDGARWLGLDRESFPATASVRQAELLSLREHATGLRDHLARAAAGGTGLTAAAALERLASFQREHVGVDKVNAVKPWRQAINGVEQAEAHLADVRSRHELFRELASEADAARHELEQAEQQVLAAEAGIARRDLAEAERAHQKLEALAAEFPDGAPVAADLPIAPVAAAVERFRALTPPGAEPTGATAEALTAALAAIPPMPDGPFEVPAQTAEAVLSYRSALEAVAEPSAEAPAGAEVDPADVEHRVRALRALLPDVEALESALADARDNCATATAAAERRRRITLAGWALIVLSAVVALASIAPAIALAGAGALALGWSARRPDERPHRSDDVSRAGAAVAAAREQLVALETAQDDAQRWLAARGLPGDADAAVAAAIERQVVRHEAEAGRARHDQAMARVAARRAAALAALASSGVVATDPVSGLSELEELCRRRAEARVEALRRDEIEAALTRRTELDELYRQRVAAERAAVEALRDAATKAGILVDSETSPDELAHQLDLRLDTWAAEQSAHRDVARRWARLEVALGSAPLEEHRAALERRRDEVGAAVAAAGGEVGGGDPAGALTRALGAAASAREQADRAAGGLAQFDAASVDVADAEARLAAAQTELERVVALKDTLTLTSRFLQRAHEQAHRVLAPRLEEEMSHWVPLVTGGTYVSAQVDPEHLSITLRDAQGRRRDGDKVSHGTAEQVHLVLRVVLADVLTQGHDRCPILLDDPTVHADVARTPQVLEFLREVSRDQQVIVFSQEAAVLDWARDRLDPDVDRLVELSVDAAPASADEPWPRLRRVN